MHILNPIEYPDWNDLLLKSDDASFFHTSNWAKVLHESYGYAPLYFAEIEADKLSVLMPFMEVNSILTGRRGVSLPFTDYCQPIFTKNIRFQDLLNEVIDYGRQTCWKYIEWRDGQNFPEESQPSAIYYDHTLDLTKNEKQLLARFRDSTKRNIKKAKKMGVKVDIMNSMEGVTSFYKLNCITRKDHGLPSQPLRFFKSVFQHVISEGLGHIVLASYEKKIIAGAIYFHFGKRALYKYGASYSRNQRLRPNNIVMWKAIKCYAEKEFETFSFGRTEPEHAGLLQFKRGWGTREHTIQYYRYDLTKAMFLQTGKGIKSSYCFLKKLPLPLLNLAGSLLYKHVG